LILDQNPSLAQLPSRPIRPNQPVWPISLGRLLPLAELRHHIAPLTGAAAPCAAVGHPSPRASGRIEAPPNRLPSPLIYLEPCRLLSLLHSLKWPVLNFHHRRSVASSIPSPHRPDAIKGARSHGHFTCSILPHLAPLIRARATQHQAPMPCSIPLRRRLHSSDEPPVATLGKVPHRRIRLFPAHGEVFPTGVAARPDSGEPLATTARGPHCARRRPSLSGSRDHELGLWNFPVEK
jgi:hypothetical protein